MRFARHATAAALAAALGFGAAGASAENMTISAEQARFYFGGLYPNYSLFPERRPRHALRTPGSTRPVTRCWTFTAARKRGRASS